MVIASIKVECTFVKDVDNLKITNLDIDVTRLQSNDRIHDLQSILIYD